jgi:hypothetical protein
VSAANLAANPVALTALAILTTALTVLAWTAVHRHAKTPTAPRSSILHRHHGRHVRGRPLLGFERHATPTSDDGVTV